MKERKKSLIDETIDDLITYVMDNDLKPGDKLPNETILGEELNVGRSTLREAVRALTSRNVLEVRHGSGDLYQLTYWCGRGSTRFHLCPRHIPVDERFI